MKKISYALGLVVILGLIGWYSLAYVRETAPQEDVSLTNPATSTETQKKIDESTVAASESQSSDEALVKVAVSNTELAEYVRSPRDFMENADNLYVFIGKVVEKKGQITDTTLRTQYDVSVIKNIYKTAPRVVTLNQAGVGYLKDGRLLMTDGDMSHVVDGKVKPSEVFLKIGGTYLFAALSRDGKNFTISAAPYDRELITADSNVSAATSLEAASKNTRVQEFEAAAASVGKK